MASEAKSGGIVSHWTDETWITSSRLTAVR